MSAFPWTNEPTPLTDAVWPLVMGTPSADVITVIGEHAESLERRLRNAERLLVDPRKHGGHPDYSEWCFDVARHMKAAKQERPREGSTYAGSSCSPAGKDCPNCPNQGWYMVPGINEEPTPQQCEWCYTVEDSKFNMANPSMSGPAVAESED